MQETGDCPKIMLVISLPQSLQAGKVLDTQGTATRRGCVRSWFQGRREWGLPGHRKQPWVLNICGTATVSFYSRQELGLNQGCHCPTLPGQGSWHCDHKLWPSEVYG